MSKQKTKGFGFEREVAYSLIQGGYNVKRTGNDNIAGVDVMANIDGNKYFIECKRYKGFSWNQLSKILDGTIEFMETNKLRGAPVLVFKANQQPALVMLKDNSTKSKMVIEFNEFFGTEFLKRPKGHSFLEGEDG